MISTFITLSDYCVLEFKQHPLGDPSPEIITSTFYQLKNNHMELLQVYNDDGDLTKTHNIKDISVAPIGGSRLALLDSDVVPEYDDYDDALIQTLVDTTSSANLVFDTMRFHFASGFDFEDVGTIILGAKHKMNNLKNFIFANLVINSITAEELIVFNTRPLYLGNAVYDKYVDVKIPSVKYMDDNFDQFGPLSFEYKITDGVGFIKNAPITVFLQEANYSPIFGTNNIEYEGYLVTQNFEASVSQTSEFDNLGASIAEALDGDYIQFFATWNGAFPDDLISILNRRGAGQNWILIHQLQVFEQVGTAYLPSGNLVIYQEDNFGEPLSYRPILKNASVAVSMSIDYTLRLFNKSTGENVIRTGSLTVFNPNKYGKSLAKIELDGGPQSQIVYNKISQTTFQTSAFNVALGNTTAPVETIERKVAVPVFFHKSNVMLSNRNALLNSNELGNEVVYGQGRMILPIDPADNFIRFNIYKQVATSDAPVPMSLNLNSSFRLSFGKSSSLVFENVKDAAFENLQFGQIAFKISKEQALKVIDLKEDLFIITVIAEDGTESMFYTGKWKSSTEYQEVILNEKAEAKELEAAATTAALVASMTKKIADLEAEVEKWKSRSAVKAIKVGTVKIEPVAAINAISALPSVSSKTNDNRTQTIISNQNATAPSRDAAQIIRSQLNSGGNQQ